MSLVAILASDLIIATRIGDAAAAAGHHVVRVDDPAELPPAGGTTVAFVDWGSRQPGWGDALAAWVGDADEARPRLVVFGPHTDVAAHREARSAGIGPMVARSKLVASLADYLAP